MHSIVSNNAGRDSDDVVTTTSQDLTALDQYRAAAAKSKRWLQTFERDGILHLRVHNEATTVALFTGIINDLDNGSAPASTRRVLDAAHHLAGRPARRRHVLGDRCRSQPSAGGACDGCPHRSVGRAFLDTTLINVVYGLANLARGQVTAEVTPKTWWANMKQGWVWDLDDFGVNQIGHPYQGNNYYNAGRAHGLSFWESAGITAFGSGTWEYFGETNHASVNDLINTTLGGIALGEVLHRTAWLVRDTRASGGQRLTKEIAAMVIDPVTGGLRFASPVTPLACRRSPRRWCPPRSAAFLPRACCGAAPIRAPSTRRGNPFSKWICSMAIRPRGRSRTPYDAFGDRPPPRRRRRDQRSEGTRAACSDSRSRAIASS